MNAQSIEKTAEVRFGPLQIAIIVLTLITAAVHFTLLFPDPLFILNSLGYLALLGAFFLNISFLRQYHNLVRWAYMAFVVVTILAWIAMGDKTWIVGYLTKLDELVLLYLLWRDRTA
ncbi:MAG: hypothetical protein P8Z00_11390 [Anaerolineales bacterium]|jgi:hypothetical protein